LKIIALEAESVRTPAQQNEVMRRLIARIRQHEHFAHVPIVVIPENNLGFESSHIADYVRNMPNVSVFTENPDDLREGVRKTAQNTDDYQRCVDRMLRLRRCFFDRNIFTSSKAYEKANGDCRAIKEELRNQLERYHWEIAEAKNNFGKRSITMTGKMGGAQDDLYVSFAMLEFWSQVHMRRAGLIS